MSRKDIGKIVELTENNAKSVFANPIVTIVIIAVIILPSLYALINIEACCDPYEKRICDKKWKSPSHRRGSV
jgi:putative membrane protein